MTESWLYLESKFIEHTVLNVIISYVVHYTSTMVYSVDVLYCCPLVFAVRQ